MNLWLGANVMLEYSLSDAEELLSKSIVSGLEDGHLVSVHGLMHEVLLALQTQGEGETGATGSIGGESKSSPAHPPVGSALAYFEAFHLVGSSARWDALREAKETYGAGCKVGVFLDYVSMPQRSRGSAEDDRTPEEKATFDRALKVRRAPTSLAAHTPPFVPTAGLPHSRAPARPPRP